jgi:hypothetical protein
VLLGLQLPGVTELFGETLEGAIFDVSTIENGVITRIDACGRGRSRAHHRIGSRTRAEQAPIGRPRLPPTAGSASRADPERQRHP